MRKVVPVDALARSMYAWRSRGVGCCWLYGPVPLKPPKKSISMRPLPAQFSLNFAPVKSSQKRVLRMSTPLSESLTRPPWPGIGYSALAPLP